MDQSFTISTLTLLLLLQGVGSLFLALVLGGLYAYRRPFLLNLASLPPEPLEELERLEGSTS